MANLNNFLELVNKNIADYLDDKVYTSLPAVITNVANLQERQQIDARVAISRVFPDGNALTGAECLDVPVVFPSGGGGSLTFPLKVNDPVLLVFSKRSIDEWSLGNGTPAVPKSKARFSVGDAIAIPCVGTTLNNSSPSPDHVVLTFAGSTVTLYNNGNVLVSAAADANVTAQGNINLNALGDVNITAGGNFNVSATEIHLN